MVGELLTKFIIFRNVHLNHQSIVWLQQVYQNHWIEFTECQNMTLRNLFPQTDSKKWKQLIKMIFWSQRFIEFKRNLFWIWSINTILQNCLLLIDLSRVQRAALVQLWISTLRTMMLYIDKLLKLKLLDMVRKIMQLRRSYNLIESLQIRPE